LWATLGVFVSVPYFESAVVRWINRPTASEAILPIASKCGATAVKRPVFLPPILPTETALPSPDRPWRSQSAVASCYFAERKGACQPVSISE
jgi:hypothetical protein